MNSADIITLILAVIAATGASLVTALATRPKISAEARQANVGADVLLSADARAWAETFQREAQEAHQRADLASARAEAAEERAEVAEGRARAAGIRTEDCERRVEVVEGKFDDLAAYTITLMRRWGQGGPLPEPPPSLRPHFGGPPQRP